MPRLFFALLLTLVAMAHADDGGKYADADGLKIYYEVHGTGKPLVLLHGAFGTAETWAGVLPSLARSRQAIVIEQQGHGHTADREGPLSYDRMSDDVAAVLRAVHVRSADVFGYSLGGAVALRLAMKHPELVGKLAVLGANARSIQSAWEPASYQQFLSLPDDFAPAALKDPYDRIAPDKSKWPVLVKKIKELGRDFKGFSDADLRSIRAPTLIMQGDRDGVKPEHAVEMMRLIPKSQLAIFPDGDHFLLFTRADELGKVLMNFFEASPKPPDR